MPVSVSRSSGKRQRVELLSARLFGAVQWSLCNGFDWTHENYLILSIYTISQWLVVLIHQVLCTQLGLWRMSSPWAIRKVLCIKFWWSPGHAFNHCPAVTSVAHQASFPCSWEQVLSIRSFQLLDIFLISSLLVSLDFYFLCLGPRICFLGNMNRACISFLSGHGS